jgi:hypothetical protein
MTRRTSALLLAVALFAAGLAALAGAARADARPAPPAPDRPEIAPPPAWIETAEGDFWLAYSSYCWTTRTGGICADYIDPRLRKDLPRLVVHRGEHVRIFVAVVPDEVSVAIGGRAVPVARSRVLELRVRRGGLLELAYFHRKGDARFAARLVLK